MDYMANQVSSGKQSAHNAPALLAEDLGTTALPRIYFVTEVVGHAAPP